MNAAKKLDFLKKLSKAITAIMGFGFMTSAAGNILHAQNNWISRIIALGAPVLFFLSFEMVARIPFRKELHWTLKAIPMVATGAVAAIMAWISYGHQKAAFAVYSDADTAMLLPIAIDGMMVVSSVYSIELGIQIRDLEAFIEAGNTKPKPMKVEAPKAKEARPTGRERIAAVLAQNPALNAVQVAKLADVKEAYAYNVMGQLRKALDEDPALQPA